MVDNPAVQIPVAGVRGGGSLVAPGGQVGVWCLSPDSSSVSIAAYRRVSVGLGSPLIGSDSFVCVAQG